MLKKSFFSFIAFTMLVTFVGPTLTGFAATGVSGQVTSTNVVESTQNNNKQISDEEVEAAGKLGFLVKGALEVLEIGIRKGGHYVSKVVKHLDPDAASYLKKNSSKVANGIKHAKGKIDDMEDFAHANISNYLQDGMKAAGVKKDYRVEIADAIANVVMALA